MNEHIMLDIETDARDAIQDFDRVIAKLKELDRLQKDVSGNQASRERIASIKAIESAQKSASNEEVANTKREQAAEKNASDQAIANTRREEAAEKNASDQAIANTRRKQAAEQNRHNENLAAIRAKTRRTELAGRAEERQIRRLRLEDQRRAREQRLHLAQLRQSQTGVLSGFTSWGAALGIVGGILGGEVLSALSRVASKTLEVTKHFEQIRLGMATFERSDLVADRQLAQIRQLAELPSVSFRGGIQSVVQLRSAGFDFETSQRLLKEISNLVALSGRSAEDLNRALYQFTQIGGLGQFRTEELRQIYEIAPQLRRIFDEVFGSSTGEGITQAIEAQNITFTQALDRVLDRLESGVRAPTDTLTNKIENLNNAFEDLLRGIGRDIEPLLKGLIDALTGLTRFLTNNRGAIYGGAAGLAYTGYRTIQDAREERKDSRRRAAQTGAIFYGGGREIASRIPRITITQGGQTPQLTGPTPFKWEAVEAFRGRWADFGRAYPRTQGLVRGVGNVGVGALLGIGVEQVANWIHGPEGVSELQQAIQDMIESIHADMHRLRPTVEAARSTLMNWNAEIRRFNESRRVTSQTAEQLGKIAVELGKAPETMLKPFLDLSQSYETRITDLTAKIDAGMRDEAGNIVDKLTELSGRQRVRVQALVDEREALEKANEILKKQVAERRKDIAATEKRLGLAAKEAIMNRQPPDLRISPLLVPGPRSVGPTIRDAQGNKTKIPDRFHGYILPEFRGDNRYRDVEFGRRDLIGRVQRDSGEEATRKRMGRGYEPFPQSIRLGDRQVAVGGDWRVLHVGQGATRDPNIEPKRRVTDLVPPTADLGLPPTAARGLLEPQYAADAIRNANRLLEELKGVRSESQRIAKAMTDVHISEAFSPQNLELVESSRKELTLMYSQLFASQEALRQLKDIPPELQGQYQRLFLLMKEGARNLVIEIEKLDKLLGKLHRYSGPKMFDEMGNLVQQRTDRVTETFATPTQRTTQQPRPSDTAIAIQRHLASSGESLYDEFIAPSLLDVVGIGSGRSAARDRALEDLKRSIEQAQKDVRQDTTINARQQAEELLEISREFEQEKRSIERQYEEERTDAWKNWVRQQLTDIPKLIFEQLKLQLAARATNEVLNALGIGGNRIPIQGGGLLDRVGGLFGQARGVQQYSAPIGPGLSGGELAAGGPGLVGTAAGVGTAVSAALAAHNIATAVVPQWNPHGTSAYDIVGEDLASAVTAPFRTFFDNMHFAVPQNDAYAHMLGRNRSLEQMNNMAASRGQQTARDLADHYDKGMRESQAAVTNPYEGMMVIDPKQEIKFPIKFNDRTVQEIAFTMEELVSQGRLNGPVGSPQGNRYN